MRESRPSWFTPGVQQDCSEFLRHLLNTIHEQEVKSLHRMSTMQTSSRGTEQKDTALIGLFSDAASSDEGRLPSSLVERSFGGLLSTTCRCLRCGATSSRTESFMDLALAIPTESHLDEAAAAVVSPSSSSHSTPAMVGGSPLVSSSDDVQPKSSSSSSAVGSVTLSSLLQHFLTPERLDGDNQYRCEGLCNGLQDGERCVEIRAAPTYLIVTLLRFSYDATSGSHSKIFTDIQYPLILGLPVQSVVPGSGMSEVSCKMYGLVGVIVHSGLSSDAGHYFCYARHALRSSSGADHAEDCFMERWYMFNDSRVTRASFDNIRSLTHKFSRDTAYVLVYRHVTSVPSPSDANITDAFAHDPLLHRYLRDAVDEDNQLFLQVFQLLI